MKFLKLAFASLWVAIPLGFFYILACAVATFIENDHGTPVAKAIVYNTWWFDLLHLYLLIAIIGCFITSKAWQRKKYASLLFHASLVLIILGAGVTRYFGFEGVMALREGEKTNAISSVDSFIGIEAQDGTQNEVIYIPANLIAGQTLSTSTVLLGEPLQLKVLEVTKKSEDKKNALSQMKLEFTYKGQTETLLLQGGIGIRGEITQVLGKDQVQMFWVWGTKDVHLPFSIYLKDFQLDRYPGSMSPSSYASEVEIIDSHNQVQQPYRIFMNNVLDYGGYRFFQSSYDKDELGSILSVNNDPGKNLTYLGYALLILGSLWLLFDPQGRFRKLNAFLKTQSAIAILLALSFGFTPTLQAQDVLAQVHNNTPKELSAEDLQNFLTDFKNNTKDFSQRMQKVLIQEQGRIKPINTLAADLMHTITGQDNFQGFSNTQLFMGATLFPQYFKHFKMIKISHPQINKLLGLDPKAKYAAFQDFFAGDLMNGGGTYVLENYAEESNSKKPALQNQFDKEIIKVNTRVGLLYSIFTKGTFKIFPDTNHSNTWRNPEQAITLLLNQVNPKFYEIFSDVKDPNEASWLLGATLGLPQMFRKIDLFTIQDPKLQAMLKLQKPRVSFEELFQNNLFHQEVQKAQGSSKQNQMTQELLKLNQSFNLAYILFENEPLNADALQQLGLSSNDLELIESIKNLISLWTSYNNGISKGVSDNQWDQAYQAISLIQAYQKTYSPSLVEQSAPIVDAEIFLYNFNFFKYLIVPFILLGVILLGIVLVSIFRNRGVNAKITFGFYLIFATFTFLITATFFLRWYVSGHAPWSNAYESMLFISWASALCALIFFRKSPLAIASSSFLTGICLFVANLGFMNPQIGNLVPVLKSYWLNIHVSVITASYGFLGLCFILGVITLFFFILRNDKRPNIQNSILSLTAISEMSMILGVLMLTVGNFLGGIWANESWGRYWGWDPKETWALISIGVYAIILHLRFLGIKNTPFIFAALSVIGFSSILMTYFGVNYYLSGMHSYAAGDPVPVPTFVYFLAAGIVLLIALAYPKRNLSFPKL